ncbi:cyclopropane-fatty-acyl-phospholipid synthase [Ketogulonicigenium robustum]|uniref:Cyclopropane-fatty-acyl-phospholipid synthase n=1 Tax=Ketogulonicigenium robustum TaxID=92947 RepID=A0A1W6NZS9_9RHOB|nr:cyclopropane-fatty-acyl-phospholipid synthase family protein [Ketogulonicigenium robustum]ARO14699.1 cyclopropane-fatty-acyl-phospholipid synthase [Ketogulonicigenium robustum]
MILTTTEGQSNLPRYFSSVFGIAQKLPRGRLDLALPDGRVFRAEGAGAGYVARIDIHDPEVFARLIREGDLGFSEAYLDGQWSSPDLLAFFDLINDEFEIVFDSFRGLPLAQWVERIRFWLQSNSKKQARKNISYHYDLGNDFYSMWLDETMTYSSAIYENPQESLEVAQTRKYKSMVDLIGAQPGDHVLEIGCGWGGFAEYAAKERGLNVTCLTISQEQFNFAQERMVRQGLTDKVTIKLQDYRDETGSYDGIASIEMIEAVGEKYWPTYFGKINDCLKPGKTATVQAITIRDDRFDDYRSRVDFIQRYVFPGGMLPSHAVMQSQIASAGMTYAGAKEFGESYSITLRRWYERFEQAWPAIAKLGFDDRFKRMWDFYLTSCAGVFHGGGCNVMQVSMTKPA